MWPLGCQCRMAAPGGDDAQCPDSSEATGIAGEMADRTAEEDAVSDFLFPGRLVSHARKTWLRVRRLKEQLAEWVETLRLLPLPIGA